MILSTRAIRQIEAEEIKIWRTTKQFIHRSGYRFYIGQKVFVIPTLRYGKVVGMSKTKGRPTYMIKVNGMENPRAYPSSLLRAVSKRTIS
jgi:hypothetical protein